MNEQDRQAIEGLFSRLAQAEQQAGPKDAEADAFIKEQIGRQPDAPYMMAQTIVMQNFALEQAQQRIAELEQRAADQPAQAGGGIFSGLFGGGKAPEQTNRSGSVPVAGRPTGSPTSMPTPQPQAGGGGFLAGAAQTAMGVAGGVLLANAIGGMFGGSSDAQAAPVADASAAPTADASAATAEAPAAQPDPAPAEPELEPAADEGGGFFDSIFGDGGDDFDI
jgi:hypothetical protein